MSNAKLSMFDAIVLILGFEPGPLIRAVASHNLNPGARIIVLTPSFKDERSDRAFDDFKRICSMMFEKVNIKIERVIINLKPLSKAVSSIRKIFSEISDMHVAICISGGMRALCIATFIAYLLTKWKYSPHIEVSLEGRVETIIIPNINKILELNITGEKLEILKTLSEYGSLTVASIAALLNKDRSTIHRHLNWLEEYGLVKRVGRNIELTELGMVLA